MGETSYEIKMWTEEFRRLRAASYFAHDGKVTKTPPGTRPMDTSCP